MRGGLIQFITNYDHWSKHSCAINSNVTSAVLWLRKDENDVDDDVDDDEDDYDDDNGDCNVRIPTLPFKGNRIKSHGLIGVGSTSFEI